MDTLAALLLLAMCAAFGVANGTNVMGCRDKQRRGP
jgi:hypothetical protein